MKNQPGRSQSPAGIFALISTLPYLKANESIVRNFALLTGFIISGMEPVRSQPKNAGFVHLLKAQKHWVLFTNYFVFN